MSFTDQKPRIATKEEVGTKWGLNSESLRCKLCDREIKEGETWRFVLMTHKGFCNFKVCAGCDGEDVHERYTEASKLLRRDADGEVANGIALAREAADKDALREENERLTTALSEAHAAFEAQHKVLTELRQKRDGSVTAVALAKQQKEIEGLRELLKEWSEWCWYLPGRHDPENLAKRTREALK